MRPRRSRSIASATSSALVRVEVRGRLVEDDERRVAQERARERDPAPLAGRQRAAAVADERLVARPAAPRRTRRRPRARPRRGPSLARPRRAPRRMLSATVPRKIVGRCGTHASCRRHASVSQSREVDAADGDAPGGRLGEAEQQARDRALAGAALADERDRLARDELEVEAVEHEPRPRRVGERHALEAHRRAAPATARRALRRRRPPAAPRAARGSARRRRARPRSRGTARRAGAAAGTARARARAPSGRPARPRPPPTSRTPTVTATSATPSVAASSSTEPERKPTRSVPIVARR